MQKRPILGLRPLGKSQGVTPVHPGELYPGKTPDSARVKSEYVTRFKPVGKKFKLP